MNSYQTLFGQPADLKNIIDKGAFLVDVRTAAEFEEGTVPGAVNIPLDTIPSQLSKFKGKEDIVLFCRSGVRSAQAKSILEQNGITRIINGGTWDYVSKLLL